MLKRRPPFLEGHNQQIKDKGASWQALYLPREARCVPNADNECGRAVLFFSGLTINVWSIDLPDKILSVQREIPQFLV